MSNLPNFDVKDFKTIKKNIKVRCKHHADLGCENYITPFKGPGSDLCREHQLLLEGWGGYAKIGRPHTFYKTELTCEWCGYDALADPSIVSLPEEVRLSAARRQIQIDHKKTRASGGSDTKENLQRLCGTHHNIKTTLESSISDPKERAEALKKEKESARRLSIHLHRNISTPL